MVDTGISNDSSSKKAENEKSKEHDVRNGSQLY
jgi:hypothetical protein